ncbi:MAG: hypothetical protein GY849_06220 [Deltaproteobacteria bacterium]|nr:hypothetical protein [Deltaproteobacteria bacterium]
MKISKDNTGTPVDMKKAEHARIRERRGHAHREHGNPAEDAVGLALSGGGIRSATFNLGLLQALERYKLLRAVDYMSTVSGGGYIGSSLTWFMSQLGKPFPFGTSRKDHSGFGGKVMAWLRAHGSYLMPGEGLSLWALIAAVLTGVVVNQLILAPVFLLLFFLLSINLHLAPPFIGSLELLIRYACNQTLFAWVLALGLGMIGIFLILTVIFALSTRFDGLRGFFLQRWMRKAAGNARQGPGRKALACASFRRWAF